MCVVAHPWPPQQGRALRAAPPAQPRRREGGHLGLVPESPCGPKAIGVFHIFPKE